MPDLAENFFVIAPDLIGFGQSTIPDPFPDNVMAWIGVRVEQCLGLMDALEIDSAHRSEEHTSELQSLMRISYAVFCLKKKNNISGTLLYITNSEFVITA